MLLTSKTASSPLEGVCIIYVKAQQTTFCAGETLVIAWLTTDGIISTQRNAEWDTDSLSRVGTAWDSWLKWDPDDWNS